METEKEEHLVDSMEDKSIYLLFILAISIHNIEEALWLPAWSKYAQRFHKHIEKHEFHFAVLIVTVMALLATSAFIVFPNVKIISEIYFGFLGAMMFNVIFPHLAATLYLRRYAPGLLSGVLLILPINGLILAQALNTGMINLYEIIVSTSVVGVMILLGLPLLFRMGNIVKDYKSDE